MYRQLCEVNSTGLECYTLHCAGKQHCKVHTPKWPLLLVCFYPYATMLCKACVAFTSRSCSCCCSVPLPVCACLCKNEKNTNLVRICVILDPRSDILTTFDFNEVSSSIGSARTCQADRQVRWSGTCYLITSVIHHSASDLFDRHWRHSFSQCTGTRSAVEALCVISYTRRQSSSLSSS